MPLNANRVIGVQIWAVVSLGFACQVAPARAFAQPAHSAPGQQLVRPVHAFVRNWHVRKPSHWHPDPAQADPSNMLEKSLGRELVTGESVLIAPPAVGIELLQTRDANGVVVLDGAFGIAPYRATIASAVFDSPAERDTVLIADADDGIRVWVNGGLATTKSKAEELKFHYHYAQVHLKQGTNRVVAKLVVGAAPKKGKLRWRFVVGFTTWDGLREEESKLTALNEIETPLIGTRRPTSP